MNSPTDVGISKFVPSYKFVWPGQLRFARHETSVYREERPNFLSPSIQSLPMNEAVFIVAYLGKQFCLCITPDHVGYVYCFRLNTEVPRDEED